MFDTVQKYKTPANIILGLIGLSFVAFGMVHLPSFGKDFLVKIDNEKITNGQIQKVMQNNKLPANAETRQKILDELTREAYVVAGAKKMGLSLGEDSLKQAIIKIPAFQENGQFNESKYRDFLKNSGLSEEQLIEELTKQYYTQSLIDLAGTGTLISDAQARQWASVTNSTLRLRSAAIDPRTFGEALSPNETDLKTYYEAHKEQFIQPQAVKFSVVAVSAKDLAKQPAAASAASGAQADMQAAKEKMADLAFNHPDSLEPIAKAFGVEVHPFPEWISEAEARNKQMPPDLVKALFSEDVLKNKHNSTPIMLTPDTYWVVRVNESREQKALTLAEAKDAVTQSWRQEQGKAKAEAVAKSTLAELQKGANPTLNWSPVAEKNLQELQSMLPPKALETVAALKPGSDGKPVYAYLTDMPVPMIVEVQSVTAPKVEAADLDQLRNQARIVVANNILNDYIDWLKTLIKPVRGDQKLENS